MNKEVVVRATEYFGLAFGVGLFEYEVVVTERNASSWKTLVVLLCLSLLSAQGASLVPWEIKIFSACLSYTRSSNIL